MYQKTILLTFLTSLCIYQLIIILTQENKTQKEIDTHIDAYIQMKQFSDSLLIAKKEHILINKEIGFANYEFDIINNSENKYRLDSLTKEFTTDAIMKFEGNNLFSIDYKLHMMHSFLRTPSIHYIPLY